MPDYLNIPSFLLKLKNLINHKSTNVYWSEKGNSFIIDGALEFSQNVLPMYFKHNNFSSFVRQLNSYGFNKITSRDSESLRSDSKKMEFYHPLFFKGDETKMANIKKKVATARPTSDSLTDILSEINSLKCQNQQLESRLLHIQTDNKLLLDGYNNLRHKLRTQVEVTDKLFKFLMRITMQNNHLNKRKRQPYSVGHERSSDTFRTPYKVNAIEGPTIHEINDQDDHKSHLDVAVSKGDIIINEEIISEPASIPLSDCTIDDNLRIPAELSNLHENIFDDDKKPGHVLVSMPDGKVTSIKLDRFPASKSLHKNVNRPTIPETSIQPYIGKAVNVDDKLLSSVQNNPITKLVPSNSEIRPLNTIEEINNEMEQLKGSLYSWEEYLSNGDVNINEDELSSLLSIISDDYNDFLPDISSKTTGKEISIYNPPIIEDIEKEKTKRLKLDLVTANKSADNDYSNLTTPKISFDEHINYPNDKYS